MTVGVGITVIGIDIGGTKTEVGLADGAGVMLDRLRLPTRAADGPDQALARIADAADELANRARRGGRSPVASWAAVSPGVATDGRLGLAPNLPGWESLPLSARLAEALGADTVALDNDVRAGARAELRWGTLRGVDPGYYVSLGTGIAGALSVGGRIVPGAHRAAGEIGLTNVADVREPWAPQTLEHVLGGRALGLRASEELGVDVDTDVLFARTDRAARRLVDAAVSTLAGVVANLALAIDPERFVIGGGMMASGDRILPRLRAHLEATLPFEVDLRPARFRYDASLHGAVALALDCAGRQ